MFCDKKSTSLEKLKEVEGILMFNYSLYLLYQYLLSQRLPICPRIWKLCSHTHRYDIQERSNSKILLELFKQLLHDETLQETIWTIIFTSSSLQLQNKVSIACRWPLKFGQKLAKVLKVAFCSDAGYQLSSICCLRSLATSTLQAGSWCKRQREEKERKKHRRENWKSGVG